MPQLPSVIKGNLTLPGFGYPHVGFHVWGFSLSIAAGYRGVLPVRVSPLLNLHLPRLCKKAKQFRAIAVSRKYMLTFGQ